MRDRPLPRATVVRLPLYLQYLDHLSDDRTMASSDEMAAELGLNAAKVRKDLWYLGVSGVRGIGYDVASLRRRLEEALGLSGDLPVVIVGAGNLGSAIAGYPGFASRGFRVMAVFDVDPDKVGTPLGDVTIRHLDELTPDSCPLEECIGVIAVPETAAQDVADRMVAAGVRSILNLAPTILKKAPGVEIRHADVATELQILAFYRK